MNKEVIRDIGVRLPSSLLFGAVGFAAGYAIAFLYGALLIQHEIPIPVVLVQVGAVTVGLLIGVILTVKVLIHAQPHDGESLVEKYDLDTDQCGR